MIKKIMCRLTAIKISFRMKVTSNTCFLMEVFNHIPFSNESVTFDLLFLPSAVL